MITSLTDDELRALPSVVDLTTAGRALGIGKSKAAEMARAGEFPCPVLTLGRRRVVRRAQLFEKIGFESEERTSEPAAPKTPASAAGVGAGYVIIALPVSAEQLPGLLAGPLAQYLSPPRR